MAKSGEELYELAIDMIDKFNQRFCDMIDNDSRCKILDRKYFEPKDDFVYGWGRFRKNMLDAGDSDWLQKIEALDEQKMLEIAERGLLKVLTGEGDMDRIQLDNYVKAIQGMANRSKIMNDNKDTTNTDVPLIKVEFMPMREEPKELDS